MEDINIEKLVNSLVSVGKTISTKDPNRYVNLLKNRINKDVNLLKNPFDISSYTNKILATIIENKNNNTIHINVNIQTYLLNIQEENMKKGKKVAYEDGLTNIANRSAIERRMNELKEGYSALMIDIDDFKHYNDNYSHSVGDIVLKSVAEIIEGNIREKDKGFVGRYGGEEFYIELEKTGKYKAKKVAERIRKKVENNAVNNIYEKLLSEGKNDFAKKFLNEKLTISIGIADKKQGEGSYHVRSLADSALSYSKKNGKNQTAIYNNKLEKSFI